MTDAEILEAIGRFPRWHYQFDLRGHITPIHDLEWVNRHAQRKIYFFDPLVRLLGGSLAGKRVLDLGCNAGFWSLCAAQSGCDYVLGIDGRQMHIDQANLVFRANEIHPASYNFVRGDIFDVLQHDIGTFDIVLCLGLLYHISKHMTLLEAISRLNTDLLVIDSYLSAKSGSVLEILHEPLDDPRNAVDRELVMNPTRRAVIEMAREFGYNVSVLQPAFSDYTGAPDYETGIRRAFLAAKVTDVQHADIAAEPVETDSHEVVDVAEVLYRTSGRSLARALVSRALQRVGVRWAQR